MVHIVNPKLKSNSPFRVCAVCGQRHAATYGFKNTLEYYGIKGDKAALKCVRDLHRTHPRKDALLGSTK